MKKGICIVKKSKFIFSVILVFLVCFCVESFGANPKDVEQALSYFEEGRDMRLSYYNLSDDESDIFYKRAFREQKKQIKIWRSYPEEFNKLVGNTMKVFENGEPFIDAFEKYQNEKSWIGRVKIIRNIRYKLAEFLKNPQCLQGTEKLVKNPDFSHDFFIHFVINEIFMGNYTPPQKLLANTIVYIAMLSWEYMQEREIKEIVENAPEWMKKSLPEKIEFMERKAEERLSKIISEETLLNIEEIIYLAAFISPEKENFLQDVIRKHIVLLKAKQNRHKQYLENKLASTAEIPGKTLLEKYANLETALNLMIPYGNNISLIGLNTNAFKDYEKATHTHIENIDEKAKNNIRNALAQVFEKNGIPKEIAFRIKFEPMGNFQAVYNPYTKEITLNSNLTTFYLNLWGFKSLKDIPENYYIEEANRVYATSRHEITHALQSKWFEDHNYADVNCIELEVLAGMEGNNAFIKSLKDDQVFEMTYLNRKYLLDSSNINTYLLLPNKYILGIKNLFEGGLSDLGIKKFDEIIKEIKDLAETELTDRNYHQSRPEPRYKKATDFVKAYWENKPDEDKSFMSIDDMKKGLHEKTKDFMHFMSTEALETIAFKDIETPFRSYYETEKARLLAERKKLLQDENLVKKLKLLGLIDK